MPTEPNPISTLKDDRVNCYSIIHEHLASEYLNIVKNAYKDRGGISGQRDPLKTSTAMRIRKRMVEDLQNGAILPPVVIGIIVDKTTLEKIPELNSDQLLKIIEESDPNNIAIIDGMQRTTAMIEAGATLNSRPIRVEYWISDNTNSLVYRMLVLNTGQVPWNLQRQIEVVFSALIKELNQKVKDLNVLWTDDSKRRVKPGDYKAADIMELFLTFGLRKIKFKMKEQLADEFSRLDFIEATADRDFTDWFARALTYMIRLDQLFSTYDSKVEQRFRTGRNIFDSQTARVGFMAAWAQEVIGRPGTQRPSAEQENLIKKISSKADAFLERLGGKTVDPKTIGTFLALPTLNELTSVKSGKVGEFEREFFLEAFRVLIKEDFEVSTLESCWRAL